MTSPQGADSPMISDAFLAFRLMINNLDDLVTVIDPGSGRMKTICIIESGSLSTVDTVTNLAQIGGISTSGFIFDEMDIVFNTGIRVNIV